MRFKAECVAAALCVLTLGGLGQLLPLLRADYLPNAVQMPVGGEREHGKVLRPVIGLHAVDVMHGLVGSEQPSELLFHDESVLQDEACQMPSARVWVFRPVQVDVPAASLSSAGEIPVRRACWLNPVAAYERRRVAFEMPPLSVCELRDRGALATSAFAQTARYFVGLRLVAIGPTLDASPVSGQEARWMVARALGRREQRVAASAFTELSSRRVDHELKSTTGV